MEAAGDHRGLARSSSQRAPGSVSKTPPAPLLLPPATTLVQVSVISSPDDLDRLPLGPLACLFALSIHSTHSPQNDLCKTHSSSCDSRLKTLLELPTVFRISSELWLQHQSPCRRQPGLALPTALYAPVWQAVSKVAPVIPSSWHSCPSVVPSS